MTQDEIIATLKEAGFIFTFDDAYLLTRLNGLEVADLVKIAELILASQTQPTPSQSDERTVFESWWFASKYCQVIYHDDKNQQIAWDGWQARANLSKPQPTSQDAERWRYFLPSTKLPSI